MVIGFIQNMLNNRRNLFFQPFGSFAVSNMGGSSAFFGSFNTRTINNVNALTTPVNFRPSFVKFDLADFRLPSQTTLNEADTDKPIVNAQYIPEDSPTTGDVFNYLFEWKDYIDEIAKRFYIGLFALLLILLGIYFIAKSTDEGQIAIEAIKTVAVL